MTKPPSLNEIYRAINLALGIERPRQFELFQLTPKPQTKSFVSGLYRHPEDNRYKHIADNSLADYCLALATQPDVLALEVKPDLERLAGILSRHGTPTWDDVDTWEKISLRLGRGKLRDRLQRPKETIRR
jgi:hypothetical protein